MKKLAILIATMLMLCVMATACGGDKDNSTNSTDSASSTSTAAETPKPSTSTTSNSNSAVSATAGGAENSGTPSGSVVLATTMVSTDVAVDANGYATGVELSNGFYANGVSKNIIVDSSSAVSFGTYTGVTNRIKLGGAMDATKKNSIKFTVGGACTLTVYAKGGNSTDTSRAGWVIDESGAQVGEPSAPFAVSGDPTVAMFDIPAAGTYYFGGNINSINVYAMSIS